MLFFCIREIKCDEQNCEINFASFFQVERFFFGNTEKKELKVLVGDVIVVGTGNEKKKITNPLS